MLMDNVAFEGRVHRIIDTEEGVAAIEDEREGPGGWQAEVKTMAP